MMIDRDRRRRFSRVYTKGVGVARVYTPPPPSSSLADPSREIGAARGKVGSKRRDEVARRQQRSTQSRKIRSRMRFGEGREVSRKNATPFSPRPVTFAHLSSSYSPPTRAKLASEVRVTQPAPGWLTDRHPSVLCPEKSQRSPPLSLLPLGSSSLLFEDE